MKPWRASARCWIMRAKRSLLTVSNERKHVAPDLQAASLSARWSKVSANFDEKAVDKGAQRAHMAICLSRDVVGSASLEMSCRK